MEHQHFSNLALYRSHKLVRAARITGYLVTASGHVTLRLALPEGEQDAAIVPPDWIAKRVTAGVSPMEGYFVVYNDGYTSWSPAKQFEEGNTPLTAAELAEVAQQSRPDAGPVT